MGDGDFGVHIGGAVHIGGIAGQTDFAAFAVECERVDVPALSVQMGFQAAVVQNNANLAIAVIQVFAVYGAAEFGRVHCACNLGGGKQRALDDVPHGHHAF